MGNISITHKHQTRANDCWYACIQMLRTYANKSKEKTKPTGEGVKKHRNKGFFYLVWGNPLGRHDEQYANILSSNDLVDVSLDVSVASRKGIQAGVDKYGPLIVGGDFGKVLRIRGTNKWMVRGLGHYIVVTGTDENADTVHINDPWHTKAGEMSWVAFASEVWTGTGRVIIANAPSTTTNSE